MALFNRGLAVPAALKRQLHPDERVLAVGETERSVLVATTQGLHTPVGEDVWHFVRWSDVVKATWSSSGLTVVEGITGDEGVVIDLPPVVHALTTPRNLPSVTRTRVEASIARAEQVVVPGGVARLVARRVPGVDGIHWTGRLDSGTPDTPEARASLISKIEGMVAAEASAR